MYRTFSMNTELLHTVHSSKSTCFMYNIFTQTFSFCYNKENKSGNVLKLVTRLKNPLSMTKPASQLMSLTLYHTIPTINVVEGFEALWEKGENAGNQHFVLYSCFLPNHGQNLTF